MRVSNNMIVNNYMRNLNNSVARQYELQQQLSDGLAIHRPSDDPVRAVRSLQYKSSLSVNTKLTQTNSDALSWMNNTDTAMNDMSSIITQVKELVVQAGGPNPDMAMRTLGEQIDTLINELVSLGNSKIGNRYLFSGQSDQVQPFKRETINGQDTVVYYGDLSKISMRLQTGTIDPKQDSIGLNGAELFGPLTNMDDGSGNWKATCDVFTDLIRIKDVLLNTPFSTPTVTGPGEATTVSGYPSTGLDTTFEVQVTAVTAGHVDQVQYRKLGDTNWITAIPDASGNIALADGVSIQIADGPANLVGDLKTVETHPDINWLTNEAMANVDAAHDDILKAYTRLGSRMSFYETMETIFLDNETQITEDISKNEDVDLAKALIDFQTSENVYRTALAVGARIIPPSLVDFL